MLQWSVDKKTFAFKELHVLELPGVKLSLTFDTKSQECVAGSITIKRGAFEEIGIEGLTVKQAKRRLVMSAINMGSSFLLGLEDSDPVEYTTLLESLSSLYDHAAQEITEAKHAFRRKYLGDGK